MEARDDPPTQLPLLQQLYIIPGQIIHPDISLDSGSQSERFIQQITTAPLMNDSSDIDQPASSMWATLLTVASKPVYVEAGDLCLTIRKLTHEWQLNYHWEKKGNNGGFACRYLDEQASTTEIVNRIAMETMSDALNLIPRLADLPLVVRPYSPFTIPAHNKITLYVTTPIWLSVNFTEGVSREFPVQQLSETWMGPKSNEGELCYGSHTHARLDKDMLVQLPWRALTPIHMHNKSHTDFTLERLSIPTPHLSLYNARERLITEPLSIVMDSENHKGIVSIGKVAEGDLISSPRKVAERGILVSAWENLFA